MLIQTCALPLKILKRIFIDMNIFPHKWRYYLSVIALFPLTACSVLSSADTESPRTYLLDIPPTTHKQATQTTEGKTLLVSMPQAAPGFDTPALVYIRTPHLIEYYSKSQWVDTPARMLLPLLVQNLETSNLFSAVLSAATSPVTGELRLDTEIVRLQQEFLTEPSQVRLILRVQLLDMVSRQVVATQTLEVVEDAPTEDAQGGIAATNQAVARMLKKLTTFLAQYTDHGS